MKNFDEAENAFSNYLQTATDPAGKAKVLLALGAVKISANHQVMVRKGTAVDVICHKPARHAAFIRR